MKKCLFASILIIFIFLTGCGKQEPVSLEYKTTEGEPPKYKVTLENKATIEGDGEEAEEAEEFADRLSISLDMTATIKTIKAEDGNLMHELVVEAGKIKESGSGDEEEIDKGEDMDMTVEKNGEIEEPFSDLPGLSPTVIFPDEPVAPGAAWTEELEYSPAEKIDPLELEINFTLEKFTTVNELKCAVIKFEVPETGIDRDKVKGTFASTGTMTFAYEKGMIVDFSAERNMTMKDPRPKSDIKLNFHQIVSIKMEK